MGPKKFDFDETGPFYMHFALALCNTGTSDCLGGENEWKRNFEVNIF
jgi:hypothetical protein